MEKIDECLKLKNGAVVTIEMENELYRICLYWKENRKVEKLVERLNAILEM